MNTNLSYHNILRGSCLALACYGTFSAPNVLADTNKSNEINVVSKPTAVTIYLDRAQVTRSMTRELGAGKYKLIFDNLPYAIDRNSVQINGSKSATLVDVKFTKKQFLVVPDEKIQKLNIEKLRLTDSITDINDKINQANSEKSFIEKISTRLTTAGNKAPPAQLDPEKWVKMVSFYRGKLTSLSKEIRRAERDKRQQVIQLNKIQRQLSQFGSQQYKTKNQVHAIILVKKPGPIKLDLSYMVHGPSWKPVYDLRVLSNKKKMNVTYNAMIKQNTGEDWKDVTVSLSTAQVNVSGTQKSLKPWRINLVAKSQNESDYRRRNSRPEAPRKSMAYRFTGKKNPNKPASKVAQSPSETFGRLQSSSVSVKTKATSVVFKIKEKYTLASDNSPHKVSIMNKKFNAGFRYSTVPKLAPYAYLKANVENNSSYPFLAGKTNVFLDNNFVAHSHMKSVAPGEIFWTFLGVDEAIKVDYKFIKRYERTEGVFSKEKVFTYEYLIKVKNKKKSKIKLFVWDQLPISSKAELKVALIQPVINPANKSIMINKQKFIEWFFTPKAGQEIKIPLKFSVSYPAGQKKVVSDPLFSMIK